MISGYFENARAIKIKIKIEPSFTQRVRATLAHPKMCIVISQFQLTTDAGQGTCRAPENPDTGQNTCRVPAYPWHWSGYERRFYLVVSL